MKDVIIVSKFTLMEMLKRKSFIVTTIILMIIIVIGFNVSNIIKLISGNDKYFEVLDFINRNKCGIISTNENAENIIAI